MYTYKKILTSIVAMNQLAVELYCVLLPSELAFRQ